jgi:hypothetical protein
MFSEENITDVLPILLLDKYEKGTEVVVLQGSLGYNNPSLLSATKMISFSEEKTSGTIIMFRPDGLMALIDFSTLGRLWVSSHKLIFA